MGVLRVGNVDVFGLVSCGRIIVIVRVFRWVM